MSDSLKAQVGLAVMDYVHDGMKLGIGTGSTAEAFIRVLAPAIADGLKIIGVPTSTRTAALCEELGVPLTTLDETPELDLTIDGADEIDPALNLIKGGGAALLREKIVAAASREMLVIADDSKLVKTLGKFPLPIEINLFGMTATQLLIEKTSAKLGVVGPISLRKNPDGTALITDGGHLLLDASFGRIADPLALAHSLNAIPGVVEHGLFTGLATRAIVAGKDGIKIVEPKQ
ncbi:MAG: ribose-5-phosphate isomerase RpiA [Rhizobiaceae bacterium]